MKTILVTGGTGFVGSSFVNNLKNNKNYKVYIIVLVQKYLTLKILKVWKDFLSKQK